VVLWLCWHRRQSSVVRRRRLPSSFIRSARSYHALRQNVMRNAVNCRRVALAAKCSRVTRYFTNISLIIFIFILRMLNRCCFQRILCIIVNVVKWLQSTFKFVNGSMSTIQFMGSWFVVNNNKKKNKNDNIHTSMPPLVRNFRDGGSRILYIWKDCWISHLLWLQCEPLKHFLITTDNNAAPK